MESMREELIGLWKKCETLRDISRKLAKEVSQLKTMKHIQKYKRKETEKIGTDRETCNNKIVHTSHH